MLFEEVELVEVLNQEMTDHLKGELRVRWTPAEGPAGRWQQSASAGSHGSCMASVSLRAPPVPLGQVVLLAHVTSHGCESCSSEAE